MPALLPGFVGRSLFPLAAALLLAGSGAQAQAQAAAPAALTPCDTCVPGVENFGRVSEALWRGAQPTAEGFQALEKLGAKTIVSFRHDHDDMLLLRGTGLKYIRIPSLAFHPTEENLVAFLRIMQDSSNWPVFIHCAQGRDRTGYNAVAYRIVVQGWSSAEALKEMNTFHFNKIWVGNPGFIKALDPVQLAAKTAAQPKPMFMTWKD